MDVLGEVLIYHNGSIYEFTLHKSQITSCLLDSLRNRLDTRWQERSAVYSSSDPEALQILKRELSLDWKCVVTQNNSASVKAWRCLV